MSLNCHHGRVAAAGLVIGLAVLLGAAVPGAGAQTSVRPEASANVRVLVAYFSQTGHTETMARAVADGARSVPGVTVVLKKIADVTDGDLLAADAIVVGTPVYNGGVASEVKRFIDRWPFGRLKDKVGAAFCTGGGVSAGQESALLDLIRSMLVFQFVIVGGDSWQAAFGASAVIEEGKPKDQQGVDEAASTKGRGLGARAARVAQRLKAAQAEPPIKCAIATGRAPDVETAALAQVIPVLDNGNCRGINARFLGLWKPVKPAR